MSHLWSTARPAIDAAAAAAARGVLLAAVGVVIAVGGALLNIALDALVG